MTTAAKRARKKANKLKGWPDEEMKLTPREAVQLEEALGEPTVTESEHAAAMLALAAARKMKKRPA
jgi:hypothetical protein